MRRGRRINSGVWCSGSTCGWGSYSGGPIPPTPTVSRQSLGDGGLFILNQIMSIKKPEVIHKTVTGFFQFIREQGVVGLAIGFILGGAINKLVGSLVADVIQPAINLLFGSSRELADLKYGTIMYGKFLANLLDFMVLSGVVYFGFKGLKLDRLDIKKEER